MFYQRSRSKVHQIKALLAPAVVVVVECHLQKVIASRYFDVMWVAITSPVNIARAKQCEKRSI